MSNISIKHQKHRAYPVTPEKKLDLLQKLVHDNAQKSIIIVSSEEELQINEAFNTTTNVKVLDDRTLYKDKELTAELLISFDLPEKSIVYNSRLSHTSDTAYLLVSKEQEKLLYTIETLLGRAIKQEVLAEFSDVTQLKTSQEREAIKERKREKNLKDETPVFKKKEPSKEDKAKATQWEKKKKEPNKWLGKDENGKSKFSGKSGERNHSFDGTPKEKKEYKIPKKTGRSVTIKGLNKKED